MQYAYIFTLIVTLSFSALKNISFPGFLLLTQNIDYERTHFCGFFKKVKVSISIFTFFNKSCFNAGWMDSKAIGNGYKYKGAIIF